jgi:micrococcal nuclease
MYIYNVVIKQVIDGDTIKVDIDLGFNMTLNDQNIRLYGIDAPESRTSDIVEKKFGILTKSVVEKFLPVGTRTQMVSVLSQRGKFGRILGEFLVNDPDLFGHGSRFNLNKYLIDNHLAVAYDGDVSRDSLNTAHHKNRMKLINEGMIDG